ncbi:MAG: PLP-dependent aminotransferase family protein [Clostridiales bacterium]|nr:PLP-dependent aminotransferase family protein [Clostridiales bacterium]
MEYNFSDRFLGLEANAIRAIFKLLQSPDIISFAGGMPANDCLPIEKVNMICNDILSSDIAGKVLQYGATEGYQPLLESGLEYVKRVGIEDAGLDNIFILSGGQQGLDLTFKAFINPGDTVLVEDPTYLASLHILKTYQGEAVGIKSDDDGINIADLEAKIIANKPKLIYLVPTFSNPTGKTLSLQKRKQIYELLVKYNVVLIEDDPYGELRFEGERVPSIKSLDKTGHVIYVCSFSKIISPGLRIGIMIANSEIIKKVNLGKQATDVHSVTLSQAIVDEFIRRGYIEKQIKKLLPVYLTKKTAMINAIKKYFPKGIYYTNPQGGLFIWVELPKEIDALELLPKAIENKVAYITGNSFYADGSGLNTLRLNFSNATEEQIEKGIKTIGEIFAKAMESKE